MGRGAGDFTTVLGLAPRPAARRAPACRAGKGSGARCRGIAASSAGSGTMSDVAPAARRPPDRSPSATTTVTAISISSSADAQCRALSRAGDVDAVPQRGRRVSCATRSNSAALATWGSCPRRCSRTWTATVIPISSGAGVGLDLAAAQRSRPLHARRLARGASTAGRVGGTGSPPATSTATAASISSPRVGDATRTSPPTPLGRS